MPVLSINQINAGAMIATSEEPRGERRDIGSEATGSDGSMVVTRQTRKRDLTIRSVPLTRADAHAWESLLIGEGECWSFDVTGLYGSKGLGPSASTNVTAGAGTSKFGAGRLSVGATTGTVTYQAAINSFGATTDWSVAFWRSTDSGATWAHYLVRSDGAKWLNGARADGTSTTFLTVVGAAVTIANTTGSAVLYDDLVVLPFRVLDAWPPQLGVAAVAFSPLPYLNVTGDMVPEQSTRVALGRVTDAAVRVAGSAGFRVRLDVVLKAK